MNIQLLKPLAFAAFLIAGLAAGAEPVPGNDVQDFVFLGEARPLLVRLHVHLDGKPLQSAWDDFMKYLFDYLDINGDGVLDRTEAERAPAVDLLLSGIPEGRRGGGAVEGPKPEELDADGDGKVTRSELATYYRKNGCVPFAFHLDSPKENPGKAAAALFGGSRPEPSVEAVNKAIFQLLDTDGNGKLTTKELAAAPILLLELDENEDELVTPQELVPNTSPNLLQLAGMMAMGRQGKSNPLASSTTLVPVLTPGEAPTDLASRMQDRYGAAEKKVGPKELGLDEGTFRQLDTNGDGVLDSQELAGFVKRFPDLELTIRLGKKEASAGPVALVTGAEQSPLAGKIQMKDSLALVDLGKTRMELRSNEELRPESLAAFVRQQAQVQFRQADANSDGSLDAKEAGNNRAFRTVFKAMDRDGTGKVSEKQLLAYLDHLLELRKRAAAGCVTLELSDQSRGLFDLLDTQRTGRLSVRAMRQAPRLLEQLDRQGQGFITRNDIPRTYRLEVRRGPDGQGRGDPNAAFFERYAASANQAETEPVLPGPLWFRKMDRNRDGDVSRKEYLFGEELFRQIDADGDGLISVEEAERYEAKRRASK